ncbi:uncharacterized protein LOC135688534 [Rhopilema esculentum]|uniref:uncharacterized protein LOC135688534 n=1 Tax=Rhopilema esculentum TaxID=499914 RepID=UPI0031D929FA|eukprot:gene7157-12814_t
MVLLVWNGGLEEKREEIQMMAKEAADGDKKFAYELRSTIEPLLYRCELNNFNDELLKICEEPLGLEMNVKAKILLVAINTLSTSKKFCITTYKENQYIETLVEILNNMLSKELFTAVQFLVAIGEFIEKEETGLHKSYKCIQGNQTEKMNNLLKKSMELTAQLLCWVKGYFSTENMKRLSDISSTKLLQETLVKVISEICKLSRFPEHPDYKDVCLLGNEQMPLYSDIAHNCLRVLNHIANSIYKHFILDKEGTQTMFVKQISKYCLPEVIILAFAHMGKHEWTTPSSRKEAKSLVTVACKLTNSRNTEELLIGYGTTLNSEKGDHFGTELIFTEGVLSLVLEKVCLQFSKNGWKKDPSLKHVVLFATVKVKYPNLNSHFRILIPLLLEVAEDYHHENQVLGIGGLHYLLENVNASELNLYNHSELIYQVLFKMLYRAKFATLQVLLPCLKTLLFKLEPFPSRISLEKNSRWDEIMRKLISNLEYESKRNVKEVLLENIISFAKELQINCIKYLSSITKTTSSVLEIYDGQEGQLRTMGLELIKTFVLNCWPVIHKHVGLILKILLRLIVDLCLDDAMTSEERKKFIKQMSLEIIKLLSSCCGTEVVKEYLITALDAQLNDKLIEVKQFLEQAMNEVDELGSTTSSKYDSSFQMQN